jgi:hypothetical protein
MEDKIYSQSQVKEDVVRDAIEACATKGLMYKSSGKPEEV